MFKKKFNVIFVISGVIALFWRVFIKFRWHSKTYIQEIWPQFDHGVPLNWPWLKPDLTWSWTRFYPILSPTWPHFDQYLPRNDTDLTLIWPWLYTDLTPIWPWLDPLLDTQLIASRMRLEPNLTSFWPILTQKWLRLDPDLTPTWPWLNSLLDPGLIGNWDLNPTWPQLGPIVTLDPELIANWMRLEPNWTQTGLQLDPIFLCVLQFILIFFIGDLYEW